MMNLLERLARLVLPCDSLPEEEEEEKLSALERRMQALERRMQALDAVIEQAAFARNREGRDDEAGVRHAVN